MADNTQQIPVERSSEGQGWWGSLKDTFYNVAVNVGSTVGLVSPSTKILNDARMSNTPGTDLMDFLAQTDQYKSGEGLEQLNTVRNDKEFMDALNSALRSDRTILSRMANAGGEGGMAPQEFLQQLQDSHKRSLMTKVLTVVGKDDNDGFGATYLSEVIGTAKAGKLGTLDQLLGQAGIEDEKVKLGAQFEENPLGAMMGFLTDPNKRDAALKSWIDDPDGPMAGLDDNSKNMIAGLVQTLSKFLGIYMPGQGIVDPYIDLGKRIGGELAAQGAEVRGVANMPEPPAADGGLMGSGGNPRAASLSGNFNARSAGEPDAAPATAEPPRYSYNLQAQTSAGMAM